MGQPSIVLQWIGDAGQVDQGDMAPYNRARPSAPQHWS